MSTPNGRQPAEFGQEMSEQDLFEQYVSALSTDPNAQAPRGLDPQLAETYKKMAAQLQPPDPSSEFTAALRARLERAAAVQKHQTIAPAPRRLFLPRRSFVIVGAVVVLALVSLALWFSRPPSVNAEQLLERARNAANNLQTVGVNSFQMTQESYMVLMDNPAKPPTRSSTGVNKTWYDSPTRWRIESHYETTGQPASESLTVSDGAAQWDYNPSNNTVMVQPVDPRNFPTPSVLSLDLLREDMSNCYEPHVVGTETVAGRPTYKVELGPALCRSASAPELNGPHTIWIDRETFFVLKSEIRAVNSDRITSAVTTTEVQYNPTLSADLFAFTPSANAKVNDLRPKPAPNAAQFTEQLRVIAQQVAFPVFAPTASPNGLVPRAPQYNEIDSQVELEYVPPDEASTNTQADQKGIVVVEKLADYELVRAWTDGAEPMDMGGNQGWLRRGDYDATTGLGSNSAAMVLRDGTLVSASSFEISAEDLVKVAKSLAPVQGSHAPLPNPTAPTLDELRAQVNYPYLVPTYVPEGMTPTPPTSHQLEYYRPDGSLGLLVSNTAQGEGAMEQDPRFEGKAITLTNGTSAHLLNFEPQIIVLWWNQDGGYVALEGHGIAQDEMLRIANSMSPTAELGNTQAPPAQPTPTPVPAPSFAVLRPTWLPAEMTITEANVPGPTSDSSGIEIRYDPHPNDPPHDVLTLTEYPALPAPEPPSDPQAITQDINGHSVTIIKRGKGCVSYYWEQDGVRLQLTNPYDPPGKPGEVRYSCDEMARVVASIR